MGFVSNAFRKIVLELSANLVAVGCVCVLCLVLFLTPKSWFASSPQSKRPSFGRLILLVVR